MKSLDDYRVIVPARVKSTGEFLSHNLHPRAHHNVKKRSANASRSNSESERTLHYKVTLDDRHVHLELLPNEKFLGRQVVVERWKSRYGNLSDVSVRKLKDRHGCHYTGSVRGETSSKAAVATCQGLVSRPI